MKAAKKKGEELDFDLVDGQSFISYLPAYAIAEEVGKKKVVTYHETWLGDWMEHKGIATGLGGEILERLALKKDWDGIVSVSEFTKGRLAEHGVDPNLVKVVPNGVELSNFEGLEAEESDRPTVCTVSRLTEKKRVGFVMRAFEKVAEDIPEAQLKVVGDGPEFDELKGLSEKLAGNIELLGYLSDKKDVIKVMKSSHLFVSASVLEGFGISILEAAASGTPYIVSDIPPHLEVTKEGKGGLTFEKDNRKGLTEKMKKMIEDDKLYERKKSECSNLAEEYDWKKITGRLESVYESILENR